MSYPWPDLTTEEWEALLAKQKKPAPEPEPEPVSLATTPMGRFPVVSTETHGPAVHARDLFNQPVASLMFPLNRKTADNAVEVVPLSLPFEPTHDVIPVAGLVAYVDKPRKDPPDVVHLVMRDGRERWLIQEGHTRLAAARARGETEMPVRLWQFFETDRGTFDPMPRGLHRVPHGKRGFGYRLNPVVTPVETQADLTYREKLALLLGGAGSGNFDHEGRPGQVGGSGESQPDTGATPAPAKPGKVGLLHPSRVTAVLSKAGLKAYRRTRRETRPGFNVRVKNPYTVVVDATYATKGSTSNEEIEQKAAEYERLLTEAGLKVSRPWGPGVLAVQTPIPVSLGGAGSGNFGHAGRPGEIGGSAANGGGDGKDAGSKAVAGAAIPAPAPSNHSVSVPVENVPDLGTERPTPIKVATVADAVDLILKGQVVEVKQISDVHTLLEKLAAMSADAKAKGEKAPRYDLCQVSVPGHNLFCGSILKTKEFPDGVPRIQMPQLMGKPLPGTAADKLPKNPNGNVDAADAFVAHLESQGITVSDVQSKAASGLMATQKQLKGPEVAGMMLSKTYDPGKKPIFVSRDGYVLDGHHRWAAVVGRDAEDGRLGDSTMNVRVIDRPMSELLLRSMKWSEDFGIAPKEAETDLRAAVGRLVQWLNVRERLLALGGPGSGNFGHAGRPGEIGGSGSNGGSETAGDSKEHATAPTPGAHLSAGEVKKTLSRPSSAYPPANPDGKDTQQRFKKDGVYTPERQELHKAIQQTMKGTATPVEQPTGYVMGGGWAAGKSTLSDSGALDIPENHIKSDGDSNKAHLPEYKEGLGKDKGISNSVHEESSDIAKSMIGVAAEGRYNVVLDGTGNTSIKSLQKKIDTMRAGGLRVVANYVTVDTETALARAQERGEKTGRYVPTEGLKESHRKVSEILPKAMEMGLYDEATLWDTNGESPVKVASSVGKEVTIHDKALWDRFKAKATEGTSTPAPKRTPEERVKAAKERVSAKKKVMKERMKREAQRRRESPGTTTGVAQQKRDWQMAQGRRTQELVRAIRKRQEQE